MNFNDHLRNYMVDINRSGSTDKPLQLPQESLDGRTKEQVADMVAAQIGVACGLTVDCICSVMPDGSMRVIVQQEEVEGY